MTIRITRQQYLDAQAKVVEDRGYDYVYPEALRVNATCQYVINDQPGCIVGASLAELGVPLAELHKFEGVPASTLFHQLRVTSVLSYEPGTMELASRAQNVQDRTVSHAAKNWGKAHEASLEEKANYWN